MPNTMYTHPETFKGLLIKGNFHMAIFDIHVWGKTVPLKLHL